MLVVRVAIISSLAIADAGWQLELWGQQPCYRRRQVAARAMGAALSPPRSASRPPSPIRLGSACRRLSPLPPRAASITAPLCTVLTSPTVPLHLALDNSPQGPGGHGAARWTGPRGWMSRVLSGLAQPRAEWPGPRQKARHCPAWYLPPRVPGI